MGSEGMEADSPRATEGHTEEASASSCESNTKLLVRGEGTLQHNVGGFQTEGTVSHPSIIEQSLAISELSSGRIPVEQYFELPSSYLERSLVRERSSHTVRFSNPETDSNEALLGPRPCEEPTEVGPVELPATDRIPSSYTTWDIPARHLGNRMNAGVRIEGGYDTSIAYPTGVEQQPPNAVYGRRGVNPFEQGPTRSSKLWERVLHIIFQVLTHELYEPCCHLLTFFQLILVVLQEVQNVANTTTKGVKAHVVTYYLLFAIFTIYTVDAVARILVTGRIAYAKASVDDRTSPFQDSWREKLSEQIRKYLNSLFSRFEDEIAQNILERSPNCSVLGSFTTIFSTVTRRKQLSQNRKEFILRLSINGQMHLLFDVVIVLAFWISITLENRGFPTNNTSSIFRMISSLRIFTLLEISQGTQAIVRHLKAAIPQSLDVLLLVAMFWLLFAIIGVQTFMSQLRRSCVSPHPSATDFNALSAPPGFGQSCGGWLDMSGSAQPWQYPDGRPSKSRPKGYLCPQQSICVEDNNPFNGTLSFDGLGHSLELAFVVMSSSSFSNVMYHIIDSNSLACVLYFVILFVVMRLWLVNILISVVASAFVALGDFTKRENDTPKFVSTVDKLRHQSAAHPPRLSVLKKIYDRSYWFWIVVIIYGFVCQCLRSVGMSHGKARFLQTSEFIVSLVLLTEVAIRLCSDWRDFPKHKENITDLIIALVTTVITIPGVGLSDVVCTSLSIFQVLRIYRLVLAVPFAQRYTYLLLSNVWDIISLVAFLVMLTFFVALLACQLLRGVLPSHTNDEGFNITFGDPLNSFIGIYQILSTDRWSNILFDVTAYGKASVAGIWGPILIILWFMSVQCKSCKPPFLHHYTKTKIYVLIAFIAMFQRRLDFTEQEKYTLQFRKFLINDEQKTWSFGDFSISKMFDMERLSRQRRIPLDYGPATLEMLLNDAIVQQSFKEFDEVEGRTDSGVNGPIVAQPKKWWKRCLYSVMRQLERMFDSFRFREPNPFHSQLLQTSKAIDDLDAELTQNLGGPNILELHDTFLGREGGNKTMAVEREVALATQRRARAQEEYLLKHPHYDRSLYMFDRNSRIRKFCQLLVPPGRGERIDSSACSKSNYISPAGVFEAFIDITIIAMVVVICIATPVYQRATFQDYPHGPWNWVSYTYLTFALIFSTEALIRTIADGLYWTPNTYWLGPMGLIDSVVMIILWTDLIDSQVSSQIAGLGAFKVLRVFRLRYLFKPSKSLVLAVLGRLSGLLLVVVSAVVFLMGFSAYGLALFCGRFDQCNDHHSTFNDIVNCGGEYSMQDRSAWNILAPRAVIASKMNFDNFRNAIFTLFQMMSRRGFADVMMRASSIEGSPSSHLYSLYFIAFNLVTTIFVLILLLSTFIRNATENTGQALLTSDQKSWVGLRTLLGTIQPSKWRQQPGDSRFKIWCYRLAIRKHGNWHRFITGVLAIHTVLLCLQLGPNHERWDRAKDYIFLALLPIYALKISIDITGLTWLRFRRSFWALYALVIVSLTIIAAVIAECRYMFPYHYIYHLGLDLIVLLIIPRFDRLSRAWTTATMSLLPLGNIMLIWAVCFVVFAVAFTATLGLAPFSADQNWEMNFRSIQNSLVLLFKLSYGDEWPQLMESVASVTSSHCVKDYGQCINPASVQVLFTIWNILSMYFFANACTAIVYSYTSVNDAHSTNKAILNAVSRDDMRRFKEAWALFDPHGTGYVTREYFPRLLGELSGSFEIRIYDNEWTVRRILEECQDYQRYNHDPLYGVDIGKMNKVLSKLPIREIQKRREKMDLFYSEVLVGADPDRGIAFVNLLQILAQYNIVEDHNGLQLEESLQRRARLRKVEEQRMQTKAVTLIETLVCRRRFLRYMARRRDATLLRQDLRSYFTEVPDLLFTEENYPPGRTSNDYIEGFGNYLAADNIPIHRRV